MHSFLNFFGSSPSSLLSLFIVVTELVPAPPHDGCSVHHLSSSLFALDDPLGGTKYHRGKRTLYIHIYLHIFREKEEAIGQGAIILSRPCWACNDCGQRALPALWAVR